MANERKDWHGAFCDAMQLELKDEEGLGFQREVVLNTKPIIIDLLIVKNINEAKIKNEIGGIFKKYNIFEYKSPGYHLGIDTYFKVISYASLYKSYNGFENEIKSDDITITFVREQKPIKLLKWFERKGFEINCSSPGIYIVNNAPLFETQILVTKELENENHIWIKSLTKDVNEKHIQELLEEAETLKNNKYEKYTDSILYLIYNVFEIKNTETRDEKMYEKTMSLFKDRIDKIVSDAVNTAVSAVTIEKDEVLAQRETQLAQRETQLAQRETQLAQRDEKIAQLEAEIAKLKNMI